MINDIRPNIFIDIGANVGFYSLFAGKFTNVGQIFSFEPTPETFNELKENAVSNNFPIVVKNIALSNSISTLKFADFGQMSGKNGIVDTSIHNVSTATVREVPTNIMDNIFDEQGDVIALKIDTEGHEVSVIEGGKLLLSKNKCIIQIELGHGKSGPDVSNLLRNLGYEQILNIGPDSYFTNIQSLLDKGKRFYLLQSAMDFLVKNRWK